MATKIGDVKVGNTIQTGVRDYKIEQELDSSWVLYTYTSYGEKKWGACRKTSLVGEGYKVTLPFFEKDEVYKYAVGGTTGYTVEHVAEKGGVKVALVWCRSDTGHILWTHFEQSEFGLYKKA